MKRYIQFLGIIIFLATSGISLAMVNPYELPEDYSVVNDIQAKSNLSDHTWFLKAAALGVGGSAAVGAGAKAYELLNDWKQLESYTPTSYISTDNSKILWALAGAAGVGFAAYKIGNPYLERAILNKIKTYVNMCEKFNVAQQVYTFPQEELMAIGQGEGNAIWRATNIARLKGIDNLLAQGKSAKELLDRLQKTPEVQYLHQRVDLILGRLDKNRVAIAALANEELAQRRAEGSANIAGAQQLAEHNLTRQQTSALWWTKVMGVWNAGIYSVKSMAKLLAYINDNKGKIAGGMAAIYFLPSLARAGWEVKNALPQVEQLPVIVQK